jgi:hypothetical protein
VSQGARRASSLKFNGGIILEKKQRGKARTSFVLITRTLSYPSEGTCDCSLSLLGPFSFSNLGLRFPLRREGCDTPSVYTVAATLPQQYHYHVCTVVTKYKKSLNLKFTKFKAFILFFQTKSYTTFIEAPSFYIQVWPYKFTFMNITSS